MGGRQSDGRIVPLIATNNAEGKPRESRSSRLLPCKTISTGKHYLYAEIENVMETKLARIAQLSAENPNMVFTS